MKAHPLQTRLLAGFRKATRHLASAKKRGILTLLCVVALAISTGLYFFDRFLLDRYGALESKALLDRNGEILTLFPNAKGEYARYAPLSPRMRELLVKKEDRYFYLHPGINPGSMLRALVQFVTGKTSIGSSTITEQLAKNLLHHENDRTVRNKLQELAAVLALEIFHTKDTILEMYGHTVYMGNNIQGLHQASIDYFGKSAESLADSEIVRILATLSNPSARNPWRATNALWAERLSARLDIEFDPVASVPKQPSPYAHTSATAFELSSIMTPCADTCRVTIDKALTDKLRAILARNIEENFEAGARTGAIVVLSLPESELLAIVGSPDPLKEEFGYGINMATKPRPIGSTAKPFIYLEAFASSMRPYTLIEDREYKFPIATGFPLYPKNYDGRYHGSVTAHAALSNSYNVPAVSALQYVGLPEFYDFLLRRLGFTPLNDLDSYQYGIALGGLEMDTLTLTHFFTIFPNRGVLKPLRLFLDRSDAQRTILPPMGTLLVEKQVAKPEFTELVTYILKDRTAGVEQFGLKSNLNLSAKNYAVKTGTSRDYHDSWTVGYTPDFVVAVWLGNAENEPLRQLSGTSGAGKIWNESMELLFSTPYNRKTPFRFDSIKEFSINGTLEAGLPDDVIEDHRNLLAEKRLILSPHDGDTIRLESRTTIPLKASREVTWYANGEFLGVGQTLQWKPQISGAVTLEATRDEWTESLVVRLLP